LVTILLPAPVLGPLVTTTTTGAYLNDPATKTYILSNLSLQSDWQLPGVFVHNVYPVAVNGSLWTLPLEVKSYVILAVLGLVAVRLRRRGLMTIAAVLAVLVAINGVRSAVPGGNDFVAALAQIQVTSATAADAARGSFTIYAVLFASFAIGGALYELRRFVPVLWPLALLVVVLLIVAGLIGGNAPAYGFMIATPYLVLCVAYRTRSFVRLPRWMGDYSYGLYIYAFPIQQTLSQLLVPVSAWVLFLLAVPITAGLAILSWHFVERPALNLKPAPSEPVPVLSGIADVLAMPADAVPVDTAEPVRTSVSS
jgi:peptidoglycan/LPS O-acetylase OafA/YrhL